MEVKADRADGIPVVSPQGRLDAHGASQLDEAFKAFIREDDSTAVIDMGGVQYLSSGGIRVLVAAQRMLARRQGGIHLCSVTQYPMSVLEMAGFDQFFQIHTTRDEAIRVCKGAHDARQWEGHWDQLPSYEHNGARFAIFEASADPPVLKVVGSLAKVLYARLRKEDVFLRRFSETEYSIGLGALGGSVDDCLCLLGEMITIGGTMVWLPTDGNDTPDFLIPRKDTGAVMIHTGLNVALDGPFNQVMTIESEHDDGLSMSEVYSSVFEIARQASAGFRGLASIAMLCDVVAVYSSGVKISPVEELAPGNGKMIVDPANSDTWMDITSEPRHRGMTMASFGVGLDLSGDLPSFGQQKLDSLFYLHPANIGDRSMMLHNHGVIFEPLQWRRTLQLDEEIKRTIREGEFVDMRHLLDSTRIARAVIGVSHITDIVFEQPEAQV